MGIVSHTVDCSSLSIEKDHLNNVEYKFSGVIVSFFKWLYWVQTYGWVWNSTLGTVPKKRTAFRDGMKKSHTIKEMKKKTSQSIVVAEIKTIGEFINFDISYQVFIYLSGSTIMNCLKG